MKSWRDQILREFVPGASRLLLVADPDGLLREEGVAEGIRERGFEVIPFEDPVEFRFVYESRYRSHWDRGETTGLVVVLHTATYRLEELPYDLLEAGRRLEFSIADIFPNLSASVVAELTPAEFDALYRAVQQYPPDRLGERATCDYILLHVFKMAPSILTTPVALLKALLARHYAGRRLPPILDKRLIELLRSNDEFESWPLEEIVPDARAFFAFLQERWPLFLDSQVDGEVHEPNAPYALKYPGPDYIPFDHTDIRVYIDNLFGEGLLRPVRVKDDRTFRDPWVLCGVERSAEELRRKRVEQLFKSLDRELPDEAARYDEWLHAARRWGVLRSLAWRIIAENPEDGAVLRDRLEECGNRMNLQLVTWLRRRYSGLRQLPPPVMVHHLGRYLARQLTDGKDQRIALVVVDGLALDQWETIRDVLEQQAPELEFDEQAVFAWLPTLTSVSRQAIFSGMEPRLFADSLRDTNREERRWVSLWEREGVPGSAVKYCKGLGTTGLEDVEQILDVPGVKVLGLVVDTVDRIMHGSELGMTGMHRMVEQWAQEGFLRRLLELLLDRGFGVYLTSDHGNTEARGIGNPGEGAASELRGQRVRVYPDERLRSRVADQYPEAIPWDSVGLPEDWLPLFAPPGSAFIPESETVVAHGGCSLEELVVPLVRISRRGGE